VPQPQPQLEKWMCFLKLMILSAQIQELKVLHFAEMHESPRKKTLASDYGNICPPVNEQLQ
jgi:hypothetical protein